MSKRDMAEKQVWAVIGVTPDKSKFGNRIYLKLKNLNKTVYAINPKYDTVEGDVCYKSLKDLPEVPEVIDFVVNPYAAKEYIKEAKELGVKNLWFQPGTYTEELLTKSEGQGFEVVTACVLVDM